MKNKKIWLGILALALVFGMTIIGCDDDSKNDGKNNNVTFINVIADGSQTTSELTLIFSQAITGLSISDIKLSGLPGIVKGNLSGPIQIQSAIPNEPPSGEIPSESQEEETFSALPNTNYRTASDTEIGYVLGINGLTTGGTLNVAVSKSGYTISGSPRMVIVSYNGSGDGGGISDLLGTWIGGNTLTFTSNNVTCSYAGFGTRTYSVSGNTITFENGAGGSANYTLSANKRTLTISNPTGTLAAAVASGSPYTKQ